MESNSNIKSMPRRIRKLSYSGGNNRGPGARVTAVAVILTLIAMPAYAAPPIANAGAPQTVDEQTTVDLNGTGSTDDGTITTYAWSQTSGPGVTLNGSGTATPSFEAPVRLVSQGNATLVFQLTVTDDEALDSSASVTITVQPVNTDPTANAGANQTVDEQTPVNLNGAGSSDADGPIASYAWTQTQGPNVSLAGANSATPSASPSRSGDPPRPTRRAIASMLYFGPSA